MKKILIVYATAGIGHKKAACAVKEALDEISPQDIEVTLMDALDYTNAFFKWSYLKVYLMMVNKLPTFWGFLYYLTDNCLFNSLISKLRRLNNWLNSGRLVKYLLDTKPDVIISTHFFASEVISDLKGRGILSSRLFTIVTDYRLHSWWIADHIDAYIVGSEDAKADLVRCKMVPSKIVVSGIPVEPRFTKILDRAEILKKTDLKENIFTVLVIGGGFGVGPIEEIVKTIGLIPEPIQVVAVCGHNEELVKRLNGLRENLKIRLNVLGFVDNVYEYMEVSNILISKSGGITVSESLAKTLPLIVISPIIGQETRNSDFMVNHGAALKIDHVSYLKGLLEDLISHPEKVEKIKDAIRALRKPMACYDISNMAIETCRKN